MEHDVFLHVGLFKTATKFFQQNVFPYMNGIQYVKRRMYEKTILKRVLFSDYVVVKREADSFRKQFETFFSGDKGVILSHELFSGNPMYQSFDRYTMTLKLKSIFPGAKILLGLRGQRGMIDSIYREYVVQGGVKSFNGFVHNEKDLPRSILDYDPHLDVNSLYYGPYIDALAEQFGKENLFVFPYESLVDDDERLLREMCDFMGVDCGKCDFKRQVAHESLGDFQLQALRWLNFLFRSSFNHRGIIPYAYNPRNLLRYTNALHRKKGHRDMDVLAFTEDNAYIDAQYGLGLKDRFAKAYGLE